jgi:hypothetical protein
MTRWPTRGRGEHGECTGQGGGDGASLEHQGGEAWCVLQLEEGTGVSHSRTIEEDGGEDEAYRRRGGGGSSAQI